MHVKAYIPKGGGAKKENAQTKFLSSQSLAVK